MARRRQLGFQLAIRDFSCQSEIHVVSRSGIDKDGAIVPWLKRSRLNAADTAFLVRHCTIQTDPLCLAQGTTNVDKKGQSRHCILVVYRQLMHSKAPKACISVQGLTLWYVKSFHWHLLASSPWANSGKAPKPTQLVSRKSS